MKISQISTEKAADVLCEISTYIVNITLDQRLVDELKSIAVPNGEQLTVAQVAVIGAEKITNIVPLLLKDHKRDVFGILAAINGKTIEEIASQTFINTLAQIKDAAQDQDLIDFFKSFSSGEKK